MEKVFKIGDFLFQIKYPDDLKIPEHFLLFESEQKFRYKFSVNYTKQVSQIEGNVVAKRHDILIINSNGLESRYLRIKGDNESYALYHEINPSKAVIYYEKEKVKDLNIDPLFTSLFALEKHLIQYNEMILHCAYMIHNGEAILFSAPSETGKTTQANLWQKYRNTRVINGDRSLLSKKDDKWYANGWPVCGTSEVCFNETYPIKCIVMLSQAKENSVELLDPMTAFKQLYSQITINTWNTEFNLKVMDLIDQLIKDVPIYHLACNISEDAVNVLEKEIYK